MLPFPEPQSILENSLITKQLELNPAFPAKSSYFPFSPPIIFPPEGLHDLLILPAGAGSTAVPQPPPTNYLTTDATANSNAATLRKNADAKDFSRKRTGRTDRHTKICTAGGLRDRRMRLSLDVARKFFDLQDMLGFDKASKTVQWLLTMTKAAIEELVAASAPKLCSLSNHCPNSEAYSSDCEDAYTVSDSKHKSAILEINDAEVKKSKNKIYSKKPQKKAGFQPMLTKETRAQARARARERTREKKMMCFVSSRLHFEAIEEEQGLQSLKSSSCEERDSSFNNHSSMKLTTERNCEFPMASGSGMTPVFEFSSLNTTNRNDAVSLLQQEWDMERVLLAEVKLNTVLSGTFNNSFTM